MFLVIGGIKGGSGKTTLATNLAVLRAETGKKVLLVDADEQQSTLDWVNQREAITDLDKKRSSFATVSLSGKLIYSQLQKMRSDYDDIIIDTGGRDTTSQRSALTCADIYLIPFKPRSIDIWTIGTVKRLINEIQTVNPKIKCLIVINQADSKGTDNESALTILSECHDVSCLPVFIGNRKAFANAASDGLAVVELDPKDHKACKEIRDLYNQIYL